MPRVHSIATATITDMSVDDQLIKFVLSDDRVVAVPTSWSRRLSKATPAARGHWVIEAAGTEVHWPDVDEDIGLWTMLGVAEDDFMEAVGYEVHR